MTSADATHFDDYRKQTKLKHEILRGYLPAFFIAQSSHPELWYIDGFAGRGTYTDSETGIRSDGSPLLTLSLLAEDPKLGERVHTLFVEYRDDHFSELQLAVGLFMANRKGVIPPLVKQGQFAEHVREHLEDLRKTKGRLPPTFLFVDPCGVSGTSFTTIVDVVRSPGSELFLFFNSSGIERVIGVARKVGRSKTLDDLFGSQQRVEALLSALSDDAKADEIERIVLAHYSRALMQEANARFILPYRIESDSRRDTSHYLIHATKSPLGFRLMKHVMIDTLRSSAEGALAMAQASASLGLELRFDLVELRQRIMEHLRSGTTLVSVFTREWVERPEDVFSEGQYRDLLLDMESKGLIQVFEDQACTRALPASKRQQTKNGVRQTTLGEKRWLRLTPPGVVLVAESLFGA